MKRPTFAFPNIDLGRGDDIDEPQDFNGFSLGDTSYCQDGLSIGKDYLRFEGITIMRGKLSPNLLTLHETIGRGAFNKVQRAVWEDPDSTRRRTVAVKEYRLLAGASPQKLQMLLHELRSLCTMESSCLVQMFGAFLDKDTVFLVLELMNRGSLEQVLDQRNKPFSEPMVAGAAYQLLQGLKYLHSRKKVHRDCKTENCLMHSDGSIKLSDFGTVSMGDRSMYKTVVGTTKFMAPERLRAKHYGNSSDLWSLALVLRHLATGEKPWASVSSMVDLLVTIEETSTKELIPLNAEGGFKDILESCLQLAPQKRMPAAILLQSPWFSENHKIVNVKDAVNRVLDEEVERF